MRTLAKGLTIGAVIAMSLGLVACDPTPPAPASPSPSASELAADPTPSPRVDLRDRISSIVIDRDSVYVTVSEGGIYVDIPFTTPVDTAVSLLNDALRSPATVSTIPSSSCFHERQQASWGGLKLISGDDWQRAPGAQFMVTADAAATASGVAIAVLGGQSIGASASDVIAGASGAYVNDFGGGAKAIHYDVAHGNPTTDPDNYWGAGAGINGGVLASIYSPINYFFDC